MSIIAEMAKEFRFEVAHFLPNVPETHQCRKMHGHSYLVTVRAEGVIDGKQGWVMAYRSRQKNSLPFCAFLITRSLTTLRA